MFYLKKTMEIAGAHSLNLPYESKCKNLHGHNWIITVHCKCHDDELDNQGMIVDFSSIKRIVNELDHTNLNDLFVAELKNPTAENIAEYLCNQIPFCYKVTVQESSGNEVTYEAD